MPIQYKHSHFMGVKVDCPNITIYDDEDVEEIRQKLLDAEEIAVSVGDLRLLPKFPNLKRLEVLCGEFFSEGLAALYRHKNLEALCFEPMYLCDKNDAEGVIDLREFPNIRAVFAPEYNVAGLSEVVSLQTLGIETSSTDLSFISKLTKLDSLATGGNKLCSLNGIEDMRLECLTLDSSKKLTDISALEASSDSLRYLTIERCVNIGDLSVLSKLKRLEWLRITGRNGTLDDLGFIGDLPELRFFITDYNVLDGDLEPLMKLPYATVLLDRRHYNMKDDELNRDHSLEMPCAHIPKWRRIF